MKIPLNQAYHIRRTRQEHPTVDRLCTEYQNWVIKTKGWHTSGRWYDCALILAQIDFTGLAVCEVGARGSFLMSYLTQFVKSAHVSDNFVGWDMGDYSEWCKIWKDLAPNPERLSCSVEDARRLNHPDGVFDVVISLSAIEHILGNGDIEAAREMGRVCRPGGKVVIGTEFGAEHGGRPGSVIYDKVTLRERLIEPSGCRLLGPFYFEFDTADKREKSDVQFTSCLFILEKPS